MLAIFVNYFSGILKNAKISEQEFIISEEDIIIEQETRSQISKTIIAVLEELTNNQKERKRVDHY